MYPFLKSTHALGTAITPLGAKLVRSPSCSSTGNEGISMLTVSESDQHISFILNHFFRNFILSNEQIMINLISLPVFDNRITIEIYLFLFSSLKTDRYFIWSWTQTFGDFQSQIVGKLWNHHDFSSVESRDNLVANKRLLLMMPGFSSFNDASQWVSLTTVFICWFYQELFYTVNRLIILDMSLFDNIQAVYSKSCSRARTQGSTQFERIAE